MLVFRGSHPTVWLIIVYLHSEILRADGLGGAHVSDFEARNEDEDEEMRRRKDEKMMKEGVDIYLGTLLDCGSCSCLKDPLWKGKASCDRLESSAMCGR